MRGVRPRAAYTDRMYGYEPPRAPTERGSWAEVLAFIIAAFQVLFPFLAIVIGALGVVLLLLYLYIVNAWLTLIPLSVIAAGIGALLLRERRNRLAMTRRIEGTDTRRR